MWYKQENEKKLIIQGNEILLPFPIKSLIDFGNLKVVYIAPVKETEYFNYIKLLETFKIVNLVAIDKAGITIWEHLNRFIASIKKVRHQSPLILLNNTMEEPGKNTYDLLIDCQGWNFYINPETGEKIREEQTK